MYVVDLDTSIFSHGLSYPLARLSLRLTVTLCGVVCNLLSHLLHCMILGDNPTSLHYARSSSWTSAFSLQGVVHIESAPYWFHVWSFSFYHIHLSGCLFAQFQLVNTDILHWLVSGILWRLCMHCLVPYSFSGRELISPRQVPRILPQSNFMPIMLFELYLHSFPIFNLTTFLIYYFVLPPSLFMYMLCICIDMVTRY